jgi:serine/threonine-protein kinase
MQESQLRAGQKVVGVFIMVLLLSFMIIGVLLARKNLRDGRGDRKGAMRLAIFSFSALMINWVFLAHHYPGFDEFSLSIPAVMSALFVATLLWFIYMALEPYIRRWWPHRIVAWSRLLAGDFRDPLVGRDILIGSVFGVAIQLVIYLAYLAPGGWGISPTGDPTLSTLLGLRESVGWFLDPGTIFLGLSYLFLLLLLYLLCRRKEWLSSLAAWLLPTVVFGLGARNHVIGALVAGLIFAMTLVVTMRFGLLALVASLFFSFLFNFYPMTTDFSVWYAGSTIFGLCAGLAVVVYSFYISLGGQPIFKGGLLGE